MNKLNLLVVLTFFSSLVFAASGSDNHIECSSDNAKSTYSILQCVRFEMMYQNKDLKIKVEQFIKADADIAKTIRPYMKYLSKQIDENCEIFKNLHISLIELNSFISLVYLCLILEIMIGV